MAERLRYEILDHLTESAADAVGRHASPARAAIARFGSIGEIAREYRALLMETRSRNLRWIVIAAILMVFAVMRLRGFILEPGWRDDLATSVWGTVLMAVDRYAFVVALTFVLSGLVTDRLRMPHRGAPRWAVQLAARSFVMTVLPAVLILLSALAGIASFLSPAAGNPAGTALTGLESLIVAALSTMVITILAGLFKLISAYLKVHDLAAPPPDELGHGAAS